MNRLRLIPNVSSLAQPMDRGSGAVTAAYDFDLPDAGLVSDHVRQTLAAGTTPPWMLRIRKRHAH